MSGGWTRKHPSKERKFGPPPPRITVCTTLGGYDYAWPIPFLIVRRDMQGALFQQAPVSDTTAD